MATEVTTREIESAAPAAWTQWRRIVFRFGFVYFLLYCLPSPGRVSILSSVPYSGRISEVLAWPKDKLTLWAGTHIFHLHGLAASRHPTGSGDTALDWVECAVFLLLAAIAMPLWSAFDRRRRDYSVLAWWLRLLIRFTLAFTLLSYGFAKVFPLQFQRPILSQLTETYGASSPMGILWTFMGASTAYTMFSGWAEVTAGLLLLFRRTATLGSLLALAVITNVFMLNMCYDTPVKLYSFNLIVMACILTLPDLRGIADFFLFRRTAHPVTPVLPHPQRRWLLYTGRIALVLLIGATLFDNVHGSIAGLRESRSNKDRPAMYGVWNVDSFSIDGKELAASDSRRWRQIIIEFPSWWPVHFTNGATAQSAFRVKTVTPNKLELHDAMTNAPAAFAWQRPDAQHLVFTGTLGVSPAVVHLSRYDEQEFLLTHRGFHWISEYPYNR